MSLDFEQKAVKTNIGYLYFYGKRVTEIIETGTGELLLYGKFPMSEEWAQKIRDLAAETINELEEMEVDSDGF